MNPRLEEMPHAPAEVERSIKNVAENRKGDYKIFPHYGKIDKIDEPHFAFPRVRKSSLFRAVKAVSSPPAA